jgi:hypothetical protein
MPTKLLITIGVIISLFTKCDKQMPDQPNLLEWEVEIRKNHDKSAVFTYTQYIELLKTITKKSSIALPLYQFKDTFDSSRIIIGMRHDVDRHPFKALEMSKIEKEFNIYSTYYLLPTDKYYGNIDNNYDFIRMYCMIDLYKEIFDMGHEIGIHNDLLTVMLEWGKDPKRFNQNELFYFSVNEIDIYGSTSHGSKLAIETNTGNYEIFKEFNKKNFVEYNGKEYPLGIDFMKNFGFEYEGNYIDHNKFLYDVGGKWTYIDYSQKVVTNLIYFDFENNESEPDKAYYRRDDISFDEVIEIVNDLKPGDRLIILTHPIWWGKE